MVNKFYERYLNLLREHQARLAQSILSGRLPNYEEYRSLTGQYYILGQSIQSFLDLYNEFYGIKDFHQFRSENDDLQEIPQTETFPN